MHALAMNTQASCVSGLLWMSEVVVMLWFAQHILCHVRKQPAVPHEYAQLMCGVGDDKDRVHPRASPWGNPFLLHFIFPWPGKLLLPQFLLSSLPPGLLITEPFTAVQRLETNIDTSALLLLDMSQWGLALFLSCKLNPISDCGVFFYERAMLSDGPVFSRANTWSFIFPQCYWGWLLLPCSGEIPPSKCRYLNFIESWGGVYAVTLGLPFLFGIFNDLWPMNHPK